MNYDIVKVSSPVDLQMAFEVRRRVFIDEQEVPEELELDEFDHEASTVHILARDDDDRVVGAARFRPYHDADIAKIERVAVVPSYRGTGLGRMLMDTLEAEARQAGFRTAKLNAQTHAQGFYERMGYQPLGPVFVEAGIEHIAMEKRL